MLPKTAILYSALVIASICLPAVYVGFMHAQLPSHVVPLPPQAKTLILFVCLIERPRIDIWLRTVPPSWFEAVKRVGKLVLAVGGRQDGFWDDPRAELLVLPGVRDDEYPPIGKELHLYETLVTSQLALRFQFFLKFDSDTLVSIPRLKTLISLNNWTSFTPLYAGSPLHHCDCSPDETCTADVGIHYCSGAAVLTSRTTVIQLAQQSKACYEPPKDSFIRSCGSSDSWLGWCMNNLLNLTCTLARAPNVPLPPRGKSFGKPDSRGRKIVQRHHFCQDLSSLGGVKHRRVLPNTWQFSWPDFQFCATMHALKLCEDFRYAFYNMEHKVTKESMAPCGPCFLSVLVQEDSEKPSITNTSISDWALLAKLLSVPVTSIRNDKQLMPQLVQYSKETVCAYYLVMKAGVYLRLVPLIHHLRTVSIQPGMLPFPLLAFADLKRATPTASVNASTISVDLGDDCNANSLFLSVNNATALAKAFLADMNGKFCRAD